MENVIFRKIPISEITWSLEAELEDQPVHGNAIDSGDPEIDRQVEESILKQINNGDVWAWAFVRLTGEWNGLAAFECLGCCAYKDEADFKADGYYEDMQHAVLEAIQAQAERVATALLG